jgi:hypothetical protein
MIEKDLKIIIYNIIPPSVKSKKVITDRIYKSFCEIIFPDEIYDIGDSHNFVINLKLNIGIGNNIKRRYIILNWKKLLVDNIDSILIYMKNKHFEFLIPLAAITIWNNFYSNLKFNIDEKHSFNIDEKHSVVILTMWKNCDQNYTIDELILPNLINNQLNIYEKPNMKKNVLKRILNELRKMGCIERRETGKWWLREKEKLVLKY